MLTSPPPAQSTVASMVVMSRPSRSCGRWGPGVDVVAALEPRVGHAGRTDTRCRYAVVKRTVSESLDDETGKDEPGVCVGAVRARCDR